MRQETGHARRGRGAVVAMVVAMAVVPVTAPTAVAAPAASFSQRVPCDGTEHRISVPPGVTSLNIHAVGAAGSSAGKATGGRGAEVYGSLPLGAGPTTLLVAAGCEGHGGRGFGFHRGGAHGSSSSSSRSDAGDGGGSSGVALVTSTGASTMVAEAGGGGGAGGTMYPFSSDNPPIAGGDGGTAGRTPGAGQPGTDFGDHGGCGGCRPTGEGEDGTNKAFGAGGAGGGGIRGGSGGVGDGDPGGGAGGGAGSSGTAAAVKNVSIASARAGGDGYVQLDSGGTPPAGVFDFTGHPQKYTVPAGVRRVTVTLAGGAGATGQGSGNSPDVAAGLAGTVVATLDVSPDQQLTVDVGGMAPGESGGWGQGKGGDGGSHDGLGGRGGGGGGSSAVLAGSAVLLVAGGGGGGGGDGAFGYAGRGGHGGITPASGGSGHGHGGRPGGRAGAPAGAHPHPAGGHGTDAGDSTQSGGGGGGGGGYDGGSKGHGGDVGGGGGGGGGGGRSFAGRGATGVTWGLENLPQDGQVVITPVASSSPVPGFGPGPGGLCLPVVGCLRH